MVFLGFGEWFFLLDDWSGLWLFEGDWLGNQNEGDVEQGPADEEGSEGHVCVPCVERM